MAYPRSVQFVYLRLTAATIVFLHEQRNNLAQVEQSRPRPCNNLHMVCKKKEANKFDLGSYLFRKK